MIFPCYTSKSICFSINKIHIHVHENKLTVAHTLHICNKTETSNLHFRNKCLTQLH